MNMHWMRREHTARLGGVTTVSEAVTVLDYVVMPAYENRDGQQPAAVVAVIARANVHGGEVLTVPVDELRAYAS